MAMSYQELLKAVKTEQPQEVFSISNGSYVVENYTVKVEDATARTLPDGTVVEPPTIFGKSCKMMVLSLSLRKVTLEERSDGTVEEVRSDLAVCGTKRVLLTNVLQIRKMFMKDGNQLGVDENRTHNLIFNPEMGRFDAENPIDDASVKIAEDNGFTVAKVTESEFYYLRYLGRARQGLPLEPGYEFSRVQKDANRGLYFTTASGEAISITV